MTQDENDDMLQMMWQSEKRTHAFAAEKLTENIALRAERDQLHYLFDNAMSECERLRAALEEIAKYFEREFCEGEKAYQAVIVARHALEGK